MIMDLLLCLICADALSGVVHWAEDTYATPGGNKWFNDWIVQANIDHHRMPFAIAKRTWWQNVRESSIACLAIAAVLFHAGMGAWQPYLVLLLLSQSNQVHAWAHTVRPPCAVRWLQDIGIMQSIKHHHIHHQRPYRVKYCVMTNWLNPFLDSLLFWRSIERLLALWGCPVKRGTSQRDGY